MLGGVSNSMRPVRAVRAVTSSASLIASAAEAKLTGKGGQKRAVRNKLLNAPQRKKRVAVPCPNSHSVSSSDEDTTSSESSETDSEADTDAKGGSAQRG